MLFIMTKPFESNYKATIKDYRTMQGKLHTYVLGRPPRKSTEGRVLQWLPFGWYHYAKFPAQSQPGGQGRASAHGTSRTCGLRANTLAAKCGRFPLCSCSGTVFKPKRSEQT